jgi:exonuclease III
MDDHHLQDNVVINKKAIIEDNQFSATLEIKKTFSIINLYFPKSNCHLKNSAAKNQWMIARKKHLEKLTVIIAASRFLIISSIMTKLDYKLIRKNKNQMEISIDLMKE